MSYGNAPKSRGTASASTLVRARQFIEEGVWREDASARPMKRLGMRLVRVITLVVQNLNRTEGFIRAAALTYITVLSLVPFLALGFSVAKGLGAYDKLRADVVEPFLDETFPPENTIVIPEPQGPPLPAAVTPEPPAEPVKGAEAPVTSEPTDTSAPTAEVIVVPASKESVGTRQAIEKVLEFVEKTGFGNLGAIGLVFLLLAAQKLLTSIEQAFNRIWGVRKARSWVRKLTDYTAIIFVTPILLLAATTVGSALQAQKVQDWIALVPGLSFVSYVVPLLALWTAFTFLYVCMPNTKVPIKSACIGGIVGGTLWYIFQILHVKFQVGIAGYNAIYAGFAAFPIFLAWLYSVFVIILVGAIVAWAHENEPRQSTLRRAGIETLADREVVAVRALRAMADSFALKRGLVPEVDLAAHCGIPLSKLVEVLGPLEDAGLIAHVNEGRTPGWLPTRPLDAIRLQDVLDGLRGPRAPSVEAGDDAAALVDGVRGAAAGTPANRTLAEITAKG